MFCVLAGMLIKNVTWHYACLITTCFCKLVGYKENFYETGLVSLGI